MKKFIYIILTLCIATLLQATTNVKVVYTFKDAPTLEKTYKLNQLPNNQYRLVIPKEHLDERVEKVEIFAPFATANKGEDGYWLMHRGIYGTFRHNQTQWWHAPQSTILPYYAMKTPKGSFIGIVEKMRWEFHPIIIARNGKYEMFLKFDIARIGSAYEDISVLYKRFPASADYNDFAKYYRQWKLSTTPELKTLREKAKHIPTLAKMVESMPFRLGHARKYRPENERKNYTKETEYPVKAHTPFKKALEHMRWLKSEGLEDLSVCTTCWASGGADGRCPTIFPICEEAGGEDEMKEYIAGTKELGYLIGGHINWTDAFTCSPDWSLDIICKTVDGAIGRSGCWTGGLAYQVCLKHLSNTLLPKDIPHIAQLGFNGTAYVDVFSATRPYACFDPRHKITSKDAAEIQRKIAQQLTKTCGGFASECGFDHLAAELCYINYVSAFMKHYQKKLPHAVDGFIPFWELVYHGYILSNPDKLTQNRGDVKVENKTKSWLRLVEFGGRPIFYTINKRNINEAKQTYNNFKPLKHLQWERMVSHKKLADGVFETSYENGERTIVNYNATPYNLQSNHVVPPQNYILLKANARN